MCFIAVSWCRPSLRYRPVWLGARMKSWWWLALGRECFISSTLRPDRYKVYGFYLASQSCPIAYVACVHIINLHAHRKSQKMWRFHCSNLVPMKSMCSISVIRFLANPTLSLLFCRLTTVTVILLNLDGNIGFLFPDSRFMYDLKKIIPAEID